MVVTLDLDVNCRKNGSKPLQIAQTFQALSREHKQQVCRLARNACIFGRCRSELKRKCCQLSRNRQITPNFIHQVHQSGAVRNSTCFCHNRIDWCFSP